MTTRRRLVFACSGAARAAAAVPELRRRHGADVVTLTLDLGGAGDLDDVRERALAAGAIRAHVIDAREEFAREFVLPALHAGVLDAGGGSIPRALERPLIARRLIEVARIEGAALVAHGCDAASRDRARIENAIRALDGSVGIDGVPPAGAASGTIAGARPAASPDAPASIELAFERGVPVAINGVDMTLTELLDSIAIIAAGHGVGGSVVQAAHHALEALVTPAPALRTRRENAARYADIVDRGEWFTPAREALDAFCAQLQPQVTGTVRVRLHDGACTITGRRSPFALEPAQA
jgi:argininosuccinate synthase